MWDNLLANEQNKPYFRALTDFLRTEYRTQTVYPPRDLVFAALHACPFERVRVVILGQDPYPGPGQAHGFCFSVPTGVPPPRSLRNILKECGLPQTNGNLEPWAAQGVLLLNSILTVRAGAPGSHAGHGWEQFTDRILSLLNDRPDPIVFMLWGAYARAKRPLLTNPAHLVLEAAHPSPLSASRGYFGCGHFRAADEFLNPPIQWVL